MLARQKKWCYDNKVTTEIGREVIFHEKRYPSGLP
jgi:hypothetical protein